MTAPTETDKRRSGVIELRLAGTRPPFPPLAFEAVNIIAGRSGASVFVGFRRQRQQGFAIGGQGGVVPPGFAVLEFHQIRLFFEGDAIIRQMVVPGNVLDHLPEMLDRALRSRLFEQHFE